MIVAQNKFEQNLNGRFFSRSVQRVLAPTILSITSYIFSFPQPQIGYFSKRSNLLEALLRKLTLTSCCSLENSAQRIMIVAQNKFEKNLNSRFFRRSVQRVLTPTILSITSYLPLSSAPDRYFSKHSNLLEALLRKLAVRSCCDLENSAQ